MNKKRYTFRLLDGDDEIETVLAKLDSQKRSWFIREALKFYISVGEKLNSIDNNIKTVLQKIDQGGTAGNKEVISEPESLKTPDKKEQEPLSETEQILANSIKGLLNI